jgi:AcrR family transcriptional regulator/DNA-binding MarR family transcriptional regulator
MATGGRSSRAALAVEPVSRLHAVGGERVPLTRMGEIQRARLLAAAVEIASELGYGAMSTARVSARAGVSRKTFYDLFEDREDCFLAVFDEVVARATIVARQATAGKECWRERVRAGLGALLGFLGEEPGLGLLLVVGALGAGPRVLARRAGVIDSLAGVVDQGRSEVKAGDGPLPLTGEGVVGAVLSVIHGQFSSSGRGGASGSRRPIGDRPAPPIAALMGLLNPLTGMVVLPYLGPAAAKKELERPVPRVSRKSRRRSHGSVSNPLKDLEMRLTSRTFLVLCAISEPGGLESYPSNREVAERAGVTDQGQISKLLTRLERLGLTENMGDGQAKGAPNAWRLTPKGRELAQSIGTHAHREAA